MMTKASRPAEQNVYFFGCDEALRAALEAQARARGVALYDVQTVAGLMQVARTHQSRVLILQVECLPRGRTVAALLDRLEAEAGRRPHLIGLLPAHDSPLASVSEARLAVHGVVVTFSAPFDAGVILERAIAALTQRTLRHLRLLFVHGESPDDEALEAALHDEGFRVERLTDAHRAIPTLEARPADLVILDLCMAGGAARELSAALHAHPRLRRLPVLFLAAAAGVDQPAAVLRLGQDEYLARPVSPARLADAVRGRLTRAARELRAHRDLRQRTGDHADHADYAGPRTPPQGSDEERILGWVQKALTGSGFHLVYQPILSLRRHRERYEALLRLTTPTGEVLPPLTFLPVVARHGLLPALDRWVLGTGLKTLRQERDAGRRTRLVVYQTGASLGAPGWLEWLRAEVARLDLIRQRPALEFSVPDLMDYEDQARLLFPELGRLGIEVCLAGVTDERDCLGLIARRPIGTAKLARDLIAERDWARLTGLVEALHQRRARVIAPGIEDPEWIGNLWSAGVDFIQGNYIQPPRETLDFRFDEELIA